MHACIIGLNKFDLLCMREFTDVAAKGMEGETKGEDRPGKEFEGEDFFLFVTVRPSNGGRVGGWGGIKKIRNLIRSSTPLQRGFSKRFRCF